MKRIDKVYEALQELYNGKGITTKEVAEYLNLNRANVSHDLNKLYKDKKIKKIDGRPVLFLPSEEINSLDKLLIKNKSLITPVEQAKAAILYPPRGIHTLILGETGVGKTMFANLMYEYAVEMGKTKKDATFTTFNCADYANNPQLLISQLFGVKKGAYTGANEDKIGLLEKSNGGILFLDEVHRLPPEGQEMFFTFMDSGIFRRLGETNIDRKADVLIISATTENPDSTLLRTFTRRIPMIIKLPNLEDRGLDERLNLINSFFNEESYRLGKEIKVSSEALQKLLSYPCPNNIGQLKTDIQLACAKIYSKLLTGKKNSLIIDVKDLPPNVKKRNNNLDKDKYIKNKIKKLTGDYCTFDGKEKNFITNNQSNIKDIYEIIDIRIKELKDKGIAKENLGDFIEKDIRKIFREYFNEVDRNLKKTNRLNLIVEPDILETVDEIVALAEKRLNINITDKKYLAIAFHVQASIQRIKFGRNITNPQLNAIRKKYRKSFSLALECIELIKKKLKVELPIDEAGYLTMFFVMDKEDDDESKVGVLVLAHGNRVASSIVEVTNRLLDTNYCEAIDISLDTSPKEALYYVKKHLKRSRFKEYLFLVDMGSLINFGQLIEKDMKIPIKTIDFVSTPYVLEATRKAMLGYSLKDLYTDLTNFKTMNIPKKNKKPEKFNKKPIIITACLTGEGTAISIKKILLEQLDINEDEVSIISLNLMDKVKLSKRLQNLEKDYNILFIVSSFNVSYNYVPVYSIDDILGEKVVAEMKNIIKLKNISKRMIETFNKHFTGLNGEELFYDILKTITRIENNSGFHLTREELIGVLFHLGCMINRYDSFNEKLECFDKKIYNSKNSNMYKIIKEALIPLGNKYNVNILENEIYHVMQFFIKE